MGVVWELVGGAFAGCLCFCCWVLGIVLMGVWDVFRGMFGGCLGVFGGCLRGVLGHVEGMF